MWRIGKHMGSRLPFTLTLRTERRYGKPAILADQPLRGCQKSLTIGCRTPCESSICSALRAGLPSVEIEAPFSPDAARGLAELMVTKVTSDSGILIVMAIIDN